MKVLNMLVTSVTFNLPSSKAWQNILNKYTQKFRIIVISNNLPNLQVLMLELYILLSVLFRYLILYSFLHLDGNDGTSLVMMRPSQQPRHWSAPAAVAGSLASIGRGWRPREVPRWCRGEESRPQSRGCRGHEQRQPPASWTLVCTSWHHTLHDMTW